MKMGETIAVLVVFFMLLIFGIFFYAGIESRNIQKRSELMEEKKSIDVAQIISFLPELKCTSGNLTKALCVDDLKKDVFAEEIGVQYKSYYQSVFSNGLNVIFIGIVLVFIVIGGMEVFNIINTLKQAKEKIVLEEKEKLIQEELEKLRKQKENRKE